MHVNYHLFDLHGTFDWMPCQGIPACAVRLRGFYADHVSAQAAGAALAQVAGWTILTVAPAFWQADLTDEQALISALAERLPSTTLLYGLISYPGGPRYALVQTAARWPLVRVAQPGAPDDQVAELLRCLALGFGAG